MRDLHTHGLFPKTRLRRNRRDLWSRKLVAETRLDIANLIWPLFVQDGQKVCTAVPSMPAVFRYSVDELVKKVQEASAAGLPAIALFPAIDSRLKSADGKEALNPNNLICTAIAAVKKAVPSMGVICDVALDPFTTHGHDGLLRDGYVQNDETVAVLAEQALVQARAGCDIVAPSDMMDGRVGAIRNALDKAGFEHVRILAYAAKYASAFYGPFREAVGSQANLGASDKRAYQMDPANSDEALREVAMDLQEGADMVMIKPGLPYLDVIRRVKETFGVPTFAYQVSGEYAMIKAAAERGWLNEEAALLESLLCLRRAGADAIFTYAALDVAERLRQINT